MLKIPLEESLGTVYARRETYKKVGKKSIDVREEHGRKSSWRYFMHPLRS
jgi:hypothetical protein